MMKHILSDWYWAYANDLRAQVDLLLGNISANFFKIKKCQFIQTTPYAIGFFIQNASWLYVITLGKEVYFGTIKQTILICGSAWLFVPKQNAVIYR